MRPWKVVGWSLLLGSVIVLVSLLHSLASNALGDPDPRQLPVISAATAALSDGDDVRARFLLANRTANDDNTGLQVPRPLDEPP